MIKKRVYLYYEFGDLFRYEPDIIEVERALKEVYLEDCDKKKLIEFIEEQYTFDDLVGYFEDELTEYFEEDAENEFVNSQTPDDAYDEYYRDRI